MIVIKSLYGLKSSSKAFNAHLSETLHGIGFLPTKADPEVWQRPAVKPKGFEYYEYILCYVENILCISHKPSIALGRIQAIFKFNGDKIEQTKIYLGRRLAHVCREVCSRLRG